ncbi:MAG: CdaR family protein [Butyrivibrio sp.]|nr:CdaR family protein [Butyrivibrio sp.]
MRKKLLNNWSLKIISLVLAFLLWFVVVQIDDPQDDQDMGNIPVKLVNTELLEQENKVYEILDGTDTVRVTAYAPKSVFSQLRSSDIIAEADVSRLTDINTVPITLSSTNRNVASLSGSHDSVKLTVEEKASKYVTLMSSTVGTVAEGYVVSNLTPDQNRIEVSGPKSVVEQVKYAGAEIDVTEATTNLTANVDIRLYDSDGNTVERSNLVKNVNYVRMSVEVLATKEVPVVLTVDGTPADGYMATGVVECNPMVVMIAGSAYNLSRLNEIAIPAEELDITGEREDVVRTIDVREYLPSNIRFADSDFNGTVTATVYIEPIARKTLQIAMSELKVINVPEGYEAEIRESAEDVVSVEFNGLSEQVQTLQSGTVAATVDIDAWMDKQNIERLRAGTYTVPVTFAVGEDITVRNAPSVRIVIKEAE